MNENQTVQPNPLEKSLHEAAQCWCEPETSGIEMNSALCLAFARRLDFYLRQIEELGNFIMREIPGEPSQNQGAVETAIRLLRAQGPQGWTKEDE